MRAAVRTARHSEAVEAELVGERLDVGGLVADAPSMVPVGPSVAGTIVRHPVGAGSGVDALVRPAVEAAAAGVATSRRRACARRAARACAAVLPRRETHRV